MNASPSVGGCHGALQLIPDGCNVVSEFLPIAAGSGANKRKRRPPGTPDPGAEVVALSPKALMESDKYICEICNQGFQRDQNLQMHKRRHKVPWKLHKRPNLGTHKRVFVCPEKSCLHHDPSHALGDLVGIKKHYRRKHCTEKQWKCNKCSKGYAVQSDYKAHLKTCGTRGHCCDCGRVFSRVESFIEHQDSCDAVKHKRLQSGVESERKLSHQSNATGRHSNESPSQSSDTTQAISFAQSGTWDTAARSADSTKVNEHELSRRIQDNQTAQNAAMPPWLSDRRNQLELLSFTQRLPESVFSHVVASGSTISGNKSHVSHDSRSHITRCSSIDFADHEVCYTRSKPLPTSLCSVDVNTPSLALSIRPCGTNVDLSTSSSSVDKKRSFSALEKEVLAFTDQHSQTSAGIRRVQSNSLCLAPPGSDLALSIFPRILTQSQNRAAVDLAAPGMDAAVSLKDFLKQAAPRLSLFPAQGNQVNLHQSKTLNEISSPLEMGANYNSGVGNTWSNLDNRARKIHESGRRSSQFQAPDYDLLLSKGSI